MGICGDEINEKRKSANDDNKEDKYEDNISKRIKGAKTLNTNILSKKENEIKDKKKGKNNKNKNNRNKPKKGTEIGKIKMPSIPKSSIGRSNNKQTNFLNKKDQSKNITINKKYKKKDIKENSESQNKQYLINKEKENIFTKINDSPILEREYNNINDDVPNDNEISKKIKNNSDNMEKENNIKVFTNEPTIYEKPINNIYIDIDVSDNNQNSQKIINNSIKNESNYSNLDINKNYFFVCPFCLNCPYIESIKYDITKKDFFVTYICKCELKERKNSIYVYDLIIEKDPNNSCQIHSPEELVYYCKTCEIKICIDCYKEEHNNHEINNNYLMSEENEKLLVKLMDEYKENFKGYNILFKLYNEYIKRKITINIEKLDDNFNIIKDNDYSNKINNEKEGNDSIDLNVSDKEIKNDKSIIISKNVYESIGFQTKVKMNQSLRKDNINFNNSRLEEIIKKENNNNQENLNTSIKNNKNINNPKIEESQNINDFRLFSDSENSRQINDLNDSHEKQNNIPLKSIKEEIYESKIISINEEKNVFNQKNGKLKFYYNSKTLNNHEDKVNSLIQLQSGYLVSGSNDGSIIIWDIYKSQLISKLYEIGQVLSLLEFEPNILLTGTSETNIGVWDLNKLDNISSFKFSEHSLWVNCLVKIDNNTFASASNDSNIYIWDYYNRKLLFELIGHTDCISTLIKLNDGRLCSGSIDKTIKIWNLEKRECEQELKGHKNWIMSLYQLKNGILLSSDDKSLIIWKNFNFYKSINCRCDYRNFCHIDDNCLACAAKDNVIDLLDLNNYQIYESLTGHHSNVICVIKLKDNRLASCSLDKTIKIWEQKL